MFSEYASRFLAQSQSRLSFAPADEEGSQQQRRQAPDRSRRQNHSGWRTATTSRNAPRRANPYQPSTSQVPTFSFASRSRPSDAPLFYSATDEFREENDEEEHEREIADFYALQKSRRHLGSSDLKESSDAAEDSASSFDAGGPPKTHHSRYSRPGGIRSSWRGSSAAGRPTGTQMEHLVESPDLSPNDARSVTSGTSRENMSEVRLEDTLHSAVDDEPPDDLIDNPPSIQRLKLTDPEDQEGLLGAFPPSDAGEESLPEVIPSAPSDRPRHDAFWGHVYLLAFTGMCTTWFVVYLHTEAPSKDKDIGDTIYTTLHGSYHLLAVYTLISIFVSLFWLAALRAYVRNLVYGIVIAVPVILFSFSLYPFISSFQGVTPESKAQDTAMRWSSLLPAITATLWLIGVIRGRLAMQKAITILEFATKVLAANPALLMVGFSVLGSIVVFTWIWISMFTRVFLGGHLSTTNIITRFVIDASTWWLGIFFILVYLWTIGMIFGLQRTISSATVSQWYFHRLAVPNPTSQTIVAAAVTHSSTTLFGTVALSTLLSLLVRLPLLILPKRLTMLLGMAMYSLIPTPIAALINPLSLTYAAIHSQPLAVSARGLTQLHFLAPTDATTSLHPNTFNQRGARDGWSRDARPLLAYRLAKLILHSTRFIMSLALGFGGWVSTARTLQIGGLRAGLYAYVVGLIAGAIGWGILGAMEGVLACIVDAVVVCWASEVGSSGHGEVRYCREAGYLFGEDDDTGRGRVSMA